MYAQAIAIVASAAIGAGGAWQWQADRCAAKDAERVQRHARDMATLVERQDGAATTHEIFKERERVVYQTITETVDRIVDRPVYRSACFDADGLRALNAAISGAAPAASQPAPTVP